MPRHLIRETELLKKKIITISTLVEESVLAAIRSVTRRDGALAQKVIQNDREIDQMEIDIEEECLKVLALHQPVAGDLRFIVAVLKINSDLERIGDLAVNIAERGVMLCDLAAPADLALDFDHMVALVRAMLTKALDALIGNDTAKAYEVCASDDEVDDVNRTMIAQVKGRATTHPHELELLLHYLAISRNLERIADHCTNIAEDVIYRIDGQIIRHNAHTEQLNAKK